MIHDDIFKVIKVDIGCVTNIRCVQLNYRILNHFRLHLVKASILAKWNIREKIKETTDLCCSLQGSIKSRVLLIEYVFLRAQGETSCMFDVCNLGPSSPICRLHCAAPSSVLYNVPICLQPCTAFMVLTQIITFQVVELFMTWQFFI